MTRIRFADVRAPWGDKITDSDEAYRALQKPLLDTYREMRDRGDTKVFVFDAGKVIPRSAEPPLVDGIHPDDRGFWLLSEALSPFLERLLPPAHQAQKAQE